MKNIKGIAVAEDGKMKRLAVTYDEVGEGGKVIKANVKINRIITDETVLSAVGIVEEFAQKIMDEE